MKKNIFDVKSVLSTTAVLALLSMPGFAQDIEFNKGTPDWRDTLEIQRDVAKKMEIKREKVEPVSNLKPKGIEIKDIEIDAKLLRKKVEPVSTIQPKGIVMQDTEIKAELLDEKSVTRDKVEPVSTLEPKGIVTGDLEIKAELLKEKEIVTTASIDKTDDEVETSEKEDKEEGVLSRESSLERYICQKEDQFKKLEERFTSFEKTITESTLSMQNAIAQIALMNQNGQNQNQYQIQRAPSVYDRYDQMYPMMMMQSMQNQMMMQNMNYNYTQSLNTMMMTQAFSYNAMSGMQNSNPYSQGRDNLQNLYGQNVDANFNAGQANNNMALNYDQNRSLNVAPYAPVNQNWRNISATPQEGFDFSGSTGEKVDTATTDTTITEEVTTTRKEDGLS